MTNLATWNNREKLEFKNQSLGDIDLSKCTETPNSNGYDLNTELIFEDCEIGVFNAACLRLEKKVTFRNCHIQQLFCHATYFHGGLLLENSTVETASRFDCGVHNDSPNAFIIEACTFNGHLDFFDVYFGGPVRVVNNEFREGTSLGLYAFPASESNSKEGVTIHVEGNLGALDAFAQDDPYIKPQGTPPKAYRIAGKFVYESSKVHLVWLIALLLLVAAFAVVLIFTNPSTISN